MYNETEVTITNLLCHPLFFQFSDLSVSIVSLVALYSNSYHKSDDSLILGKIKLNIP